MQQGQDVTTKRPVKQAFKQTFGEVPNTIEHVIYTSKRKPSPRRVDANVTEAGRIALNFEGVDISSVPTMLGKDGQLRYDVEFDYRMTSDGTNIVFTVLFQGRVLGNKKIAVDFVNSHKVEGRYLGTGKPRGLDIEDKEESDD